MPQAGGPSGKYGVRYEDRWTAHCAFDVLRESAQAIRIEPPGDQGEGAEFWLRYSDRVEYHQVKRQKAGEGHWPLAALRDAGVLRAFYEKLLDPTARCVFTSVHAADVLDELADRARKAVSWAEFERDFLNSETWRTEFDALHRAWGEPDPVQAFDALKRIRVATISEDQLKALNTLEAESTLDGEISNAPAVLVDLLRDRVSEYLRPHDLWNALEPHGYGPARWRGSPKLAVQIAEANNRFRSSRQDTLIGGELIKRPETQELHDALAKSRLVLVDGTAGMGKSDVLLELSDELSERGIPYLALRLDRVTPTLRPDALGAELGLPASPPAVLAAVAQDEPAVLIVDQLDAVSTTSGRSPQFFDCVSEMVRLAESLPNLQIVLSCRTFDVEHDARLRRLVHGPMKSPVVTIGALGHEQVRAAVQAFGYEEADLKPEQLSILAVPLHLALLSEIAAAGAERQLDFQTADDLYGEFWTRKRRDVAQRLGREPAWTEVIDALVDHMSAHQVLRAARELVDNWEADAEAMASSHVLTRDGRQLAFFHESFFDYAFARRFIARGRTMPELLAEDQFLFRRTQVRQILTHERENSPDQYARDLRYLVSDRDVRFHLKDLVISWLAQVKPTDEEWEVIEPLLRDTSSRLHSKAWQLIRSVSWFEFADQRGFIEERMESEDETDEMVTVLGHVDQALPGRVAELLRPYVGRSEEWTRRISWVLAHANLGGDRQLFDLFLEMLDGGEFDRTGLTRQDFWFVAHDLPKKRPEWACELLGHYLSNRLAAADAAGVTNPFESDAEIIPRNLHLQDFADDAAEGAPQAFIEHVWPEMVKIIERTGEEFREDELWRDGVWHFRHFSDVYGDLDDHLLLGAERAMAQLARTDPDRFAGVVDAHSDTVFESVTYFLFQGFTGNPEQFADAAIDFLTADRRRLRVGYSSDDHWGTRKLLEAISPQASDDALARLESVLLDYHTSWERSAHGRREFGLTQFTLLRGIAADRRSPAAQKRLAEWQRKFAADDVSEPHGVQGGVVGSPIAGDASEKMTDEQWLGAMARYSTDDFRDRREFLTGGAHQLSSVLEKQVSRDPARFARLALAMPDDANTAYFDAILRGVASSEHELPLALTKELIERCHALPGRPCGRWIARPLVRHAEEAISSDLLELISWYAINDPDPSSDRDGEDDDEKEDLLHHGLNSVRGGIAWEITRLVFARADHLEPLRPAINALVSDEIVAVRAMAGEVVLGLLRHHRDVAITLFLRLVDCPDERLLQTRYVREFLRYRGSADFSRMRPVIERMVRSNLPEVRKAGAVQATLAALDEPEAAEIAESCLSGGDSERHGAALVYAANLKQARFRARCERALTQLFDDPSDDVRSAAGNAIARLEGSQLGEFEGLARRFLETQAFADSQEGMLDSLVDTTARLPALALESCDRMMRMFGTDAGDIRTRAAYLADHVSQVLVRAYADSSDRPLKERALDLIDRSLELNLHGAYKALAEHDRPTGVAA
jgi:hypothetical protein